MDVFYYCIHGIVLLYRIICIQLEGAADSTDVEVYFQHYHQTREVCMVYNGVIRTAIFTCIL